MNIGSAILALIPDIKIGKDFEYRNDSDGNASYLIWHSKIISRPSDAEIDAEIIRQKKEFSDNEYARNRKAEYPSYASQLDEIFHNGIDSWKAVIQVTKDKYPKPE
jgi:hypothetical protein